MYAAAVSSQPFRASRGTNVGARKIAGKNKKVAACAPCEEPDLTPAATEYPAKPIPQIKSIDRTIKNPILPTAGSAPTGASRPKSPKTYPMVMPYVTIPTTAPMPIAPVVTTHLYTGNYGIRSVEVDKDDKLKKQILKTDEYGDLFNYIPTIHEIRSKMRDKSNRNNSEFTGNLIAEGRLSNKFRDTRPKKIGRTTSNSNKIRFGETILGNNPPENRSKRFLV